MNTPIITNYSEAAQLVNRAHGIDLISEGQWESDEHIKKCFNSFIGFCSRPQFILSTELYTDKNEQDLFINTFAIYVWEKPDSTYEEINLWIDICNDVVGEFTARKQLNHLNRIIEKQLSENNDKISMSLIDHVNNLTKNINENKRRRAQAIEVVLTMQRDRLCK